MSGKSARQQRQRYDPRQYQIVLQAAIEWDAAQPGTCEGPCMKETTERRSRFSGYDSGSVAHHEARVGEADNAHADRAYAEMNRRQREGDFGTIAPPRLMCINCAIGVVYMMVLESPHLGTLMVNRAMRYLDNGVRPWTAFMIVAEPGAEGNWREIIVDGTPAWNPDTAYQLVRRQVESGADRLTDFDSPEWDGLVRDI